MSSPRPTHEWAWVGLQDSRTSEFGVCLFDLNDLESLWYQLPSTGWASAKGFFKMQTEESLVSSEMGTYYELLWDVRVVILSVAGTSLDGDQQCMFNADHSLCFDRPYHSFPESPYTNP